MALAVSPRIGESNIRGATNHDLPNGSNDIGRSKLILGKRRLTPTPKWDSFESIVSAEPVVGAPMPAPRDPVLHSTPILNLRPTQITVGMHEVYKKRDAWKKRTSIDLEKFLAS